VAAIDAQFVASFWTLSGPSHPLTSQGVNVVSFEERVEAAAEAGYMGMGFIETDLAAVHATRSYAEIRKRLESAGLGFVQLELITNWFADGDFKAQSDTVREQLFEASAELGADHIKIVGDLAFQHPVEEMAESFGDLCAGARQAGARIAIELTPLTNLSTPEQGLRLIRESGASNGGLLLDVWHMGRAHIPFESLADLPGEYIYSIELDDADRDVRGTLMEDTMNNRRLPGEGDLEPAKLIAAVHKAGFRSPYAIEMVSEAHRALPVREQARVAIETARAQMKVAERYL
jgi:sugar phosphate isomerase/epimerase